MTEQEGFSLEEKIVFKIWDMPPDLARHLISFSKSNAQGKVWLAIKMLLDMYEKEAMLVDEIESMKERLDALENKNAKAPEPVKEVKTFGK